MLTKDEMVAILKDIMLHNQPISNEFFLHSAQYEEVVFFILKKHKINYETLLFSYKYYVETTQITDLLEQVKAQMNEHKSTLE